jgi:hypothetical protein
MSFAGEEGLQGFFGAAHASHRCANDYPHATGIYAIQLKQTSLLQSLLCGNPCQFVRARAADRAGEPVNVLRHLPDEVLAIPR